MSTVTHNGTDYALNIDGLDLEAVFSRAMAAKVGGSDATFIDNVVAFHTQEPFANLIKGQVALGQEPNPMLMMVSLGGPASIKTMLDAAKASGFVKTVRAAAKAKAWTAQFAEEMTVVGYNAIQSWFNDNHEALYSKYNVPTENQKDNLKDFLLSTGKGSYGYRVEEYEVDGKRTSIALNFRLDENTRKRQAKKANKAPAEAPAEAQA